MCGNPIFFIFWVHQTVTPYLNGERKIWITTWHAKSAKISLAVGSKLFPSFIRSFQFNGIHGAHHVSQLTFKQVDGSEQWFVVTFCRDDHVTEEQVAQLRQAVSLNKLILNAFTFMRTDYIKTIHEVWGLRSPKIARCILFFIFWHATRVIRGTAIRHT